MTNDTNSDELTTITLTKGYETFVDSQDSDLADLNWCVCVSKTRKTVYAYRAIPGNNKKKEYLGRRIMAKIMERDLMPGETVCYKNKNSLDNRRENLEIKIRNTISNPQL